MKAFFAIVLIAAVVGTTFGIHGPPKFNKALPECPEPGELVVTLPNPEDCSTFYKCSEYEPVLLDCLPGLWFNPDEGVCDWPENIEEGVCIPPAKK